jgi:hypothetical protein
MKRLQALEAAGVSTIVSFVILLGRSHKQSLISRSLKADVTGH